MNPNLKTTAQINNPAVDQAAHGITGHIQPQGDPVAHALAMPTILQELSRNMGEFEKDVRSQLSARLNKQAANDKANPES